MGLEERAANLFVRTQTEAKVRNEQSQGTVIERVGRTRAEELAAR
ncbi:MAG TPA: hypothetical protein VGP82_22095 [Ktedonobacterales bacterium]|jgi:hypothetical protein|nr:hypothetical protein [Ktedonobacterales bacterium]